MSRIWILDASPVIVLARAGHLDLLLALCRTPIIPTAVADEIRQGPTDDAALRWISAEGARFVAETLPPDPRLAGWDLGAGETGVLRHALATTGAIAVMDDRAARNCASALGVPLIGTLGVIVLAKRKGLIQSAGAVFDDLVRCGLRMDALVRQRAMHLAGEGGDRQLL